MGRKRRKKSSKTKLKSNNDQIKSQINCRGDNKILDQPKSTSGKKGLQVVGCIINENRDKAKSEESSKVVNNSNNYMPFSLYKRSAPINSNVHKKKNKKNQKSHDTRKFLPPPETVNTLSKPVVNILKSESSISRIRSTSTTSEFLGVPDAKVSKRSSVESGLKNQQKNVSNENKSTPGMIPIKREQESKGTKSKPTISIFQHTQGHNGVPTPLDMIRNEGKIDANQNSLNSFQLPNTPMLPKHSINKSVLNSIDSTQSSHKSSCTQGENLKNDLHKLFQEGNGESRTYNVNDEEDCDYSRKVIVTEDIPNKQMYCLNLQDNYTQSKKGAFDWEGYRTKYIEDGQRDTRQHHTNMVNGGFNASQIADNEAIIDEEVVNSELREFGELESNNRHLDLGLNLIINYLPVSVTRDKLYRMFSHCGDIVAYKLVRCRYTGISLGYAFIRFSHPDEAQQAIDSMQGYEIEGKRLKVSVARPNSQSKWSNLFVTGLPSSFTSQQVYNMLSSCGHIVSWRLLIDKYTAQSRCKAFVRFDRKIDADKAVREFDGLQLPEHKYDQKLGITFAIPTRDKYSSFRNMDQVEGGGYFMSQKYHTSPPPPTPYQYAEHYPPHSSASTSLYQSEAPLLQYQLPRNTIDYQLLNKPPILHGSNFHYKSPHIPFYIPLTNYPIPYSENLSSFPSRTPLNGHYINYPSPLFPYGCYPPQPPPPVPSDTPINYPPPPLPIMRNYPPPPTGLLFNPPPPLTPCSLEKNPIPPARQSTVIPSAYSIENIESTLPTYGIGDVLPLAQSEAIDHFPPLPQPRHIKRCDPRSKESQDVLIECKQHESISSCPNISQIEDNDQILKTIKNDILQESDENQEIITRDNELQNKHQSSPQKEEDIYYRPLGNDTHNVFVYNLPSSTTSSDLYKLCVESGYANSSIVNEVRVALVGESDSICTGYGFVVMKFYEDAVKVVNYLNGSMYLDHALSAKLKSAIEF